MEPIKSLGYSVFFDNDFKSLANFLSDNTYSKIFILVDTNSLDYCLPVLNKALPQLETYDIIELDPGEENKNIDYCIGIWQNLMDFDADRKSLMINLGGGVITDIGGFAASTFKRGIDFVQIPTTILSQVDASVGGKTGIDMGSVKNIIGTFAQPKAVFISTLFQETLSERQLISGFAEIVKHGLIADKAYFELATQTDPREVSKELIYRSVEIKNEVITKDPTEQNIRKTLNFGHTIGHAIEAYSLANDENPLLHGEAVAAGMICEAYLSNKLNTLSALDLTAICEYISSIFPTYDIKEEGTEAILHFMKKDKKNVNGKIGFVLLADIGQCEYDIYIDEKEIVEALDFYKTTIANNQE